MSAQIGPDVPFVQPNRAQRIKWLFEGIAALPPTSREITFRTAWACLWLADIQQLQGYHERDGSCFLTKTNPAVSKAVHLYPPSAKDPNTAGVVMLWRTLRIFWNEDRVNAWWQAIYGDEAGTEKPQNQICMSHSAHEMYTQGLFALEPLLLDKKPEGRELSVPFWWLEPAESTGRVDLTTQPQLPSDFNPSGHGLGLRNVRTGEPIRSGDVITLRTHDHQPPTSGHKNPRNAMVP